MRLNGGISEELEIEWFMNFNIDLKIIWEIYKKDLKVLKKFLNKIL